MEENVSICRHCGESVPDGAETCPACGRPVLLPSRTTSASVGEGTSDGPTAQARLARLTAGRAVATEFELRLPRIPEWVATLVEQGAPEAGALVEEAEAATREKLGEAFQLWATETEPRVARLADYGIEVASERDQIATALQSAFAGDTARAAESRRAVDRVLATKERHLQDAAEGIETTVRLLDNLRALGLRVSRDPSSLRARLEGELKQGHLAPLKQELRAARSEVTRTLKAELPGWIASYGRKLVERGTTGADVGGEASALAAAARAYSEGHPDEALRQLRSLNEGKRPDEAGD
ncbi:MAG: zinc ribbon domain-containing protein [Thermoplasmata archaeon]|nr:zinc ribbon domain-containing protein [Thermoplasmata archaeon]